MKIGDLNTGTIRLTRASKNLRDQWSETIDHWNDQNREDFDTNYIQPLGPQVTMLVAVVHRLQDVFEQAERDLSDKDRED
ncbi:MAG: hypothetical protein CMJ64_15570 [Planctomycetaceae bacterium]|nr:hypothetical protein [Planctomycetaceae bacterium]